MTDHQKERTMYDSSEVLPVQPTVFNDEFARKFISARREMNVHDFVDPTEGGERLCSAMDSARREVGYFMDERDLRLAEPMEVTITIEVSAVAEPKPADA